MRVLIVKTSSMGDLIHTLPAVTDAVKHCPGMRFDWVAEQPFAEIPSWHPAVETVIPISLRRWRRDPFSRRSITEAGAALSRLRSARYDHIIDAQGLIKSAIVACLARGTRAGMTWSSCREGLASIAYRKRFEISRDRHAIDRLRELFAKILGYHYDMTDLDYGLERESFRSHYDEVPYLVFLHATSAERRLWQEVEWIKLGSLAADEGFDVLLPWGNLQERLRADRLASACKSCRVLPRMNLTAMARLLAGASGVAGVDTGLSHLAAALGIPAIMLYTWTSPCLTGARKQNQLCLATRDQVNDCASDNPEDHETNIRIVAELNAASVWESLQEQMKQTG